MDRQDQLPKTILVGSGDTKAWNLYTKNFGQMQYYVPYPVQFTTIFYFAYFNRKERKVMNAFG